MLEESKKGGNKKSSEQIVQSFKKWCGRESNPRHEDFQSSALPTELPHLFILNVANSCLKHSGGKSRKNSKRQTKIQIKEDESNH